jgi:hypothetical protein
MARSDHGSPVHEFACPCLNVTLASPSAPTASTDGQWLTLNLDLERHDPEPITVVSAVAVVWLFGAGLIALFHRDILN